MTDRFQNTSSGIDGPAMDGFAITPDDLNDIAEVTRALYIGGAGDITVITKTGSQITFNGLNNGSILPVRVSRILATGTTASNIVGLV